MNLEPVSRALAEHRSAGGSAEAPKSARGSVPEAMGCLFTGVLIVLVGVLLMAFLPGRGFKLIGVVSAVIGLVAVLASAMSMSRQKGGAGAAATQDAPEDPAAPSTGPLLREQTFEPIPTSVTDHTTELLHAELKDRKPRD